MTSVSGEGWSRPGYLHKAHYFRNLRSICSLEHRLSSFRPMFVSDVLERKKCRECKALLEQEKKLEVSV